MLDTRLSLAQAFCLEYLKNKFNFYTHYFKVKMVLIIEYLKEVIVLKKLSDKLLMLLET